MTQDNAVTVQIFNQTYHLGSDKQDPDYIKQVAEYLDGKMRQATAAVGNRSPLDIAILAALDVAQEVMAARQQKTILLDETDRRIRNFTRLLEDQHPTPPSARF